MDAYANLFVNALRDLYDACKLARTYSDVMPPKVDEILQAAIDKAEGKKA